jgi:competence protein ComEA
MVQEEASESTATAALSRPPSGVFRPYNIGPEPRHVPSPNLKSASAPAHPDFSNTAQENEVLDINSANEMQLADLEQIGPVLAKRIIQYREVHGRFQSVDELERVPGIGKKRIELNRHRLVAK